MERLARALMGLLVVRFGGDDASDRHQRQLQRALRYMEEPSMLSLAIDEWREEALAQGRSEGRSEGWSEGIRQGVEREKALLQRVATRRFGVDLGDRIGALLAGEDDTERLAQVADLIVDCSGAKELLDRVRGLVDG